jgi:hypothetical protein
MTARLQGLVGEQDGVVTLDQLEADGIPAEVGLRRARERKWRKLLPGVLLTSPGPATRRQLLIAAWLWTDRRGVVDGCCACTWYGVDNARCAPQQVRLVVPGDSRYRSTGFVIVRRALAEIHIGDRGVVPYVDPSTALLIAARDARSSKGAIAVLSRGLQQGSVSTSSLHSARASVGDKYFRPVDPALVAVGVGIRSPAEEDARQLLQSSARLPAPEWNVWLDLGDGEPPVCVDALWLAARLVHEINGKRYHAWDRSFENMHRRHERLVAAGLVVIPTTATRLRRHRAEVLANVERTYAANAGRGMPDGVKMIDPPDWPIAAIAC